MSRALLIPVKELTQAKQRLAPWLSVEERRQLAWLMLEGVVRVAAALPAAWRKVMVTNYEPAMKLARGHGFSVLREERQVSESASVDWACAALEADGVTGVLRLPLDLPLIQASDLLRLVEAAERPHPVVVAPSLEGTGTNALYRAPPTLFPSRFGPGSLALHRDLAARHGAKVATVESPTLALDIDGPDDVQALLANGTPCPAADYLGSIGAAARLNERAGRAPRAAGGVNSGS